VKIMLPGPMAGPGPDGPMEGWGPNAVRELDDSNPRHVAWAEGWLKMGAIRVPDDTPLTPFETHRGQPTVTPPAPTPPPATSGRSRKGSQ
jgi:hypothetical protein